MSMILSSLHFVHNLEIHWKYIHILLASDAFKDAFRDDNTATQHSDLMPIILIARHKRHSCYNIRPWGNICCSHKDNITESLANTFWFPGAV